MLLSPFISPSPSSPPPLSIRLFSVSASPLLLCVQVHQYHASAAAKSFQSCLTLCNHIDGSPPGSSVPGILQARTLEWVAIAFSNA